MFYQCRKTIFSLFTIFSLLLSVQTKAQEQGKRIIVSPKVGEVIDRTERERYKLFQGFSGFQSAFFILNPDSTYAVQINYFEGKTLQKQVWKISKQEFVENYLRPIRRFGKEKKNQATLHRSPLIGFKSRDGLSGLGRLSIIENDSAGFFTNENAGLKTAKIAIEKLSEITIVKKASMKKTILLSAMVGAAGAAIGLLSGDDPPGWFSMTAEQKAALLGLGLGSCTLITGASYQAVKAVDIQIPLQNQSVKEKRLLLQKIKNNQYNHPFDVKFGIAVKPINYADRGWIQGYEGNLRIKFKPKAGVDLAYGQTPMFNLKPKFESNTNPTEKIKLRYSSAALFFNLTHNKLLNPYISWGLGLFSIRHHTTFTEELHSGEIETFTENYGENAVLFRCSAGCQIQAVQWIRVELGTGLIFGPEDGSLKYLHLGFTINP